LIFQIVAKIRTLFFGTDDILASERPFIIRFSGVGQQNLAIPARVCLAGKFVQASSLRIRQERCKMRTSKRSKPEILDSAPALCRVRKGNPDKVQVKRRHL
jgi:hypothetical protein